MNLLAKKFSFLFFGALGVSFALFVTAALFVAIDMSSANTLKMALEKARTGPVNLPASMKGSLSFKNKAGEPRVTNIVIHGETTNVIFEESARAKELTVQVSLYGDDVRQVLNYDEIFRQNGDRLTIEAEDFGKELNPLDFFSDNKGQSSLVTITAPRAQLKELTVNTATGDVSLNGLPEKVDLHTVSGDVEIKLKKDTRAKLFSVDSVSADIEIDGDGNPAVDSIKLNTVSGDTRITAPVAVENFDWNSVSGDLKFSFSTELQQINFNSTSGELEASGVNINSQAAEESADGFVQQFPSGALKASFNSVSGDVTLTYLPSKEQTKVDPTRGEK